MKQRTIGFLLNLLAIVANLLAFYSNIFAICNASAVTPLRVFTLEFHLCLIFFIIYTFREIDYMQEISQLQRTLHQTMSHNVIAQALRNNISQTIMSIAGTVGGAQQESPKPAKPMEPEVPRPVTTGALQFMELSDKETK